MLSLILATALVAGIAVAARPDQGRARSVPSGLYGVVYRGPTTPVCRSNDPCEAPAAGVTLLFTRPGSGLKAVETKTDADGSYRILLSAAVYRVQTDQRPFGKNAYPTSVKVRLAHLDTLDFHIDTGIR